MSGGQQALDKRMEEVKSREQAVAQAQTALVKAEEMLRNVTGGPHRPTPPLSADAWGTALQRLR